MHIAIVGLTMRIHSTILPISNIVEGPMKAFAKFMNAMTDPDRVITLLIGDIIKNAKQFNGDYRKHLLCL